MLSIDLLAVAVGSRARLDRLQSRRGAVRASVGAPVATSVPARAIGSDDVVAAGEMLIGRLATVLHLRFVLRVLQAARDAAAEGAFLAWRETLLARYRPRRRGEVLR